jgi:hypothetical protein
MIIIESRTEGIKFERHKEEILDKFHKFSDEQIEETNLTFSFIFITMSGGYL